MITCLLIHITRNSRDQAIREEQEISGDSLRIGRGSSCIIHLPDPRINLHHATIQYANDGRLYLESNNELLNFNNEFRKHEALDVGSTISIGPYQFVVEDRNCGHDIVLSYELLQPLTDDHAATLQSNPTSLAQTRWSKRAIACGLGILILLAFLALPAWNAVSPGLRASSERLPFGLDESWNPGPVSASHQAFATDCRQCHRKPFVRVEDEACTSCHRDIGNHVADKSMQSSLFGETRCASCHLEHKNNHAIALSNPQLCVDCHGDLENFRAANPDIDLNNIHDFASDHPGFKLTMDTGTARTHLQRIDQEKAGNIQENSGLKFPHDIHVSSKGINSPDGRVNLQCNSCHQPDEAGVRFKPVSMEAHCAQCHRLEFEPAVSKRQAPHADVATVMTRLREFYTSESVGQSPIDIATIDGMLRRPEQADAKAERLRASEWANRKAEAVATDLIEVRVCKTCHLVNRNAGNQDKPWSIAPVHITAQWLPKNNFSHRQHRNEKCSDCHKVENSTSSADIAIPDIATCRGCHAGATPVRNKVASTCISCHGFHFSGHAVSASIKNTPGSASIKETP